jgi:hypothetical protein
MRKLIYNQFFVENKEELKKVYESAIKSKSLESDVIDVVKFSLDYYNANLYFPTDSTIKEEFKSFEFIPEKFSNKDDEAKYLRDKEQNYKELYRKDLIIPLLDNKLPAEKRLENLNELTKLELNMYDNTELLTNTKDLNIREMYKNRKNKDSGYITNIPELDEVIGGISPGKLFVVLAPPKSYKSMFAMNTCYMNLNKENENVLFVSLEIPRDELYYKLLIRHSFGTNKDISSLKTLKGQLDEQEEEVLYSLDEDFRTKYCKSELFILESKDIKMSTIMEFKQQIEDIIKKNNIKTIFVDYLQLFSNFHLKGYKDRFEALNDVVGTFRLIGVTYNVRTVMLSQLTKDAVKKLIANKGDSMDPTSASDSSALLRDCYYLIGLFANDELKSAKQFKISLMYHRDGSSFEPLNSFCIPEKYILGDVNVDYGSITNVDINNVVEDNGTSVISLFE